MSRKNKVLSIKIIKTVLLSIFGIIMMLPVVWMLSTSFKYYNDVFKFPIEWIPSSATMANYVEALTAFPYMKWYFNTGRNTILIVVFGLLFSAMAGYAFAKLKFKFKGAIFMLYISAMMVPAEIRLIPQFLLYRKLGFINTMWAVILPWIFFVGFSIFFMRQAFMSVPDELLEAAKIDGCGIIGIFVKICLPLVKSSFMALGIITFTWGWNDYTGPMVYISDTQKQVLSVGIASFKSTYSSNFALQMAGATLALIPVIIVYLIAQKHLIEGIASSGIKG